MSYAGFGRCSIKGGHVTITPYASLDTLEASPEVAASTAAVLDAVRIDNCVSRPEIVRRTGLGKALVTERVRALRAWGILAEQGQLASSGGRPAQRLEFASDLGYVLAVEIGMTHLVVSSADLSGRLTTATRRQIEMSLGPEAVMAVVTSLMTTIVEEQELNAAGPLCGIGVGVAGPVEHATGRTVYPPVHPDWHDQPIRDQLERRFNVSAWVDNEVNLMALAEYRQGSALGHDNALIFKLGSWVGAGLVSNGKLHRGAQGCAGSLASSAGGEAISKAAADLVHSGASQLLAKAVDDGAELSVQLVAECAERGDNACQRLLDTAAQDIGKVMAVVVDFFNPSIVVVAGGLAHNADALLAGIRQHLYGSALALATRDLQVVRSRLDENAGSMGAALMTLDRIFAPERLPGTLALLARHAPSTT